MTPYYQDDWVTIYHGDCRKVMPQLPKVDLVLTSPPYNVKLPYLGYDDNLPEKKFKEWCAEWIQNVSSIVSESARMYLVISDSMLWWVREMTIKKGWSWGQLLVWCKPNFAGGAGKISGDWNYMTENICLFRWGKRTPMLGGESNTHNWFVLTSPQRNFKERKVHIAQFPVQLPRRLISRTPGDLILDPFMGSGTTLVAAKQLNRHSIGIEIEEKYCEIAAQRCSQEVLNLP